MKNESADEDPHGYITVDECRLRDLRVYPDSSGSLAVFDSDEEAPFHVRRVFYIYGMPPGARRGGHSQYGTTQLLVAVAGTLEVMVDDGHSRRNFTLEDPGKGLLIPAGIWRELRGFSPGTVCLVFASTAYDEDDYVRDYEIFRRLSINKRKLPQCTVK